MALVLTEGFDHYDSAQAAEKFWIGTIASMVPGRGGVGQAIEVVVNNPITKTLPSSYATLIAGYALKLNNTAGQLMTFQQSGVTVASLGVDGTGRLTLTDGAANLIATGTTIVPTGTWFYVELKVTVGATGHGEVQLNGATEIASTLGNFGTIDINQIVFWNHALGGQTFVDDVVVMDTSGSAPLNDFLGDVQVATLYPAADGSHTDWTPKIAGPHYQMVDEKIIDGDGSFVYDANPGDKDSYKVDTLSGSIYGAQLNIGARKGDASVRQIAPLIRQASTDHAGPTFTLSSDYVFYSWLLGNDPTGSPWTAATVNADEFGQELIA